MICIFAAATLLAFVLSQHAATLRAAYTTLGAALTVALTSTVALLPWNPYPALDLATPGYALALLLIYVGMIEPGFLAHRRIARDQVMDILTDGVLVLNGDGVIVDANASAMPSRASPKRICTIEPLRTL